MKKKAKKVLVGTFEEKYLREHQKDLKRDMRENDKEIVRLRMQFNVGFRNGNYLKALDAVKEMMPLLECNAKYQKTLNELEAQVDYMQD